MEGDVFDVIGYKVLIHAPAEATPDAVDSLLGYLENLDLEDVLAEAVEDEIELWKWQQSPATPTTVSVVLT